MKILLVFIISSLFASEEEKYTFINKYTEGQSAKFWKESMMSFDIPGLGEVRTGSEYVITSEYIEEKDKFFILQLTISDLIETSLWGDDMKPVDQLKPIQNIPCRMYINSEGELDHIATEHFHLEEIFHHHYMGASSFGQNYLYPFGKDAVNLSVGDSWTRVLDSVIVYISVDSPESFMSVNETYTLKKVKTKKGKNIAYISSISVTKCDINMIMGNEFLEGSSSGTWYTKFRYDIDSGEIVYDKSSADMDMDYKILDKTFKTTQSFSHTYKKLK